MSKKILSWDCAYKTLGVIDITINTAILLDLAASYSKFIRTKDTGAFISEVDLLLSTFIVIGSADVINLIGNKTIKEVPEMIRFKLLRNYLIARDNKTAEFEKNGCKKYDHVIIERQPAKINSNSAIISYLLAYHYVDQNPYLIGATIKNKFCFGPNLSLAHFIERYPSSRKKDTHSARKHHAAENLDLLINCFALQNSFAHIPKSKKNHVADALLQALGFLKEKKLFQ